MDKSLKPVKRKWRRGISKEKWTAKVERRYIADLERVAERAEDLIFAQIAAAIEATFSLKR